MDAGTGNLNRNLRPRHHMDKLSEFFSKFIFNINYAKLPIFILIIFWKSFLLLCYFKNVFLSFVSKFLLYSETKNRQWILSVWSGSKKERRKKEKQEKFEEVKWSHGIIGWWLYVNKFAIFFQNFPFRMTNSYVIVIDLEAKNPPYNLDLVISGLLLLLAPVGNRFWPNFQEN